MTFVVLAYSPFAKQIIYCLYYYDRFILAHPDQCNKIDIFSPGNGEQQDVDWTRAFETVQDDDSEHQPLARAQVSEIVLQVGDLLYLPTFWIHYGVSLNTNHQCSAPSGVSLEHEDDMIDCGFDVEQLYPQ